MKKKFIKPLFINIYLHYLILFIAALFIWQIFYPGLMSPDSLAQYEQAKGGMYDDWHPPLMSITMTVIIKLGGGIGSMILLQCLAALFGLRSIVSVFLRFFSNNKINKSTAGTIGTIVTLIFLIPFLTPFMMFSVIFWKDAWVAIISLWIISYLIWIILNYESLKSRSFLIHIILFSFSSTLMVLIRHNSLVILPIICIFLAIISRLKFGRSGLAAIFLPLFFVLTLNPLIYYLFKVNPVYVSNSVLASDMVVLLRFYPELDIKYPLSARRKDAPVVLLTKNGGVWSDVTSDKPCPSLNRKVCDPLMPLACFGNSENTFDVENNDCYMPVGKDNKTLKDEYFNALIQHPLKMLNAKLYLFWRMLHSDSWHDPKVACEIPLNSSEIKLNVRFTDTRNTICYLTQNTATTRWYLNWISGIHLLWLVLNITFVFYFLVKSVFKRDRKSIFLLLLFLIPLSYYLSYVAAATTPDYRFMYPSTLIIQVLTASMVFFYFIYPKFSPTNIESNLKTESGEYIISDNMKKNWTPEEKAEIIIGGLKKDSISNLCRKHNINQEQYDKWYEEFVQNAATVFKPTNEREIELEKENLKLKNLLENQKQR